MKNIFKPDYELYEGVPRINVYVMRMFFALMFLFIGYASWTKIITHKGEWEPLNAVAWCCWAAYSTMGLLGVFRTLKMLPLMLFMLFYKGLWLVAVALPLWRAGKLAGSPAEELSSIFIWIIIPLVFFPWKYFFRKYILPAKK